MTGKTGTDGKILEPEELVRLFYRYPINGFPVLDDEYRFSGIVQKRYIINSLHEFRANRMDTRRIIEKHVYCPSEGDIVRMIFGDRKIQPFPVLHRHGRFLGEWQLSRFFQVFDSGDMTGLVEYEQIFEALPGRIVVCDERSYVVMATAAFTHAIAPVIPGRRLRSSLDQGGWQCKEEGESVILERGKKQGYAGTAIQVDQKNGKTVFIYEFFPLVRESQPRVAPVERNHTVEPVSETLVDAVEELELRMIRDALLECNSNISQTAASLDIPRQTLQYKMAKYGIRVLPS